MCLPLQIKEKKKKKKWWHSASQWPFRSESQSSLLLFSCLWLQVPASSLLQPSTAAPRLQRSRSLDCNHRVELHVDCENRPSLECTRSACEVSLSTRSLTFHRAFLLLVLRVDHHGAQLGWQGVIVLDHRIGPVTHAAGYADGAHLIPCRSDHRARI